MLKKNPRFIFFGYLLVILDLFLDTHVFWILLDTFGYFWILFLFLDTHGFGILMVLDTFGYFWILFIFGYCGFWILLDTFGYACTICLAIRPIL